VATTSRLDTVLARLPGARTTGTGWLARCPAHDDRRPSLSLAEGADGRILVLCRAGCSTEAVVGALGLTMADLFPEAERTARLGRAIVATYDYRAPDGRLLYQVVRYAPKGFRVRQPAGEGWAWNLADVERVLYRLPELLAAPNADVLVVEGEQDVDRLLELGFVATTNPGGAGKWRADYGEVLRGRRVLILPDNDPPGRAHADAIRRALAGVAAAVAIVELPGLGTKGDVSDWLAAGNGAEELRGLLAAVPLEAAGAGQAALPAPGLGGSQADLLVRLAGEADLFRTPSDEPFATIAVDGHRESHPVRSNSFRLWLRRRYWDAIAGAASSGALSDAVETLAARALFGGETHEVGLRIAEYDGRLYVDLANPAWEAVEIGPTGWRVITDPPVRFRRSPTMAPLPTPAAGGSLAALRPFVNAVDELSWQLLAGSLVAALRPAGPYFVLILLGEQGSAKTTTARVFRSLIDPSRSALRAEPRDARDLLIAAKHNWLLAFDNVSQLPDWLSDALCRLSTGGGLGTRRLYTDEDETVLDAQRPVILTAITEIATRGDLLDRSIVLEQPVIGDRDRRSERGFWRTFEAVRPAILGALFDAAAAALANEPGIALERLPRMADPICWVTAAEPALGWAIGTFAAAYEGNARQAQELALDLSPIAAPLAVLAARGEWRGTATELRRVLADIAGVEPTRQRDWPKTPRALTGELKRLAPNLRAAGIGWERPGRTGHARLHVIRGTTVTSVTTVTAGTFGGDGHDGDDGRGRPDQRTEVAREMSRIFADDLDGLLGLA
jgi:hypothetical protein